MANDTNSTNTPNHHDENEGVHHGFSRMLFGKVLNDIPPEDAPVA